MVREAMGIVDERVELIKQVFIALNRSRTGFLNASEMRPFANRTGDSQSFGALVFFMSTFVRQ